MESSQPLGLKSTGNSLSERVVEAVGDEVDGSTATSNSPSDKLASQVMPVKPPGLQQKSSGKEDIIPKTDETDNKKLEVERPSAVEVVDEESDLVIDFGDLQSLSSDEQMMNDKENKECLDMEPSDTDSNSQNKDQSDTSEQVLDCSREDNGAESLDRLENTLRELEKQMSNTNSSGEAGTDKILSLGGKGANAEEPSVLDIKQGLDKANADKGDKSSEKIKDVGKFSSPENETSEDVELGKLSLKSATERNLMESVKSAENTTESTNNLVMASGSVQDSEKSDRKTKADSSVKGSDSTTKPISKDATSNANEMWSKIGMLRCANCSFTTDQESMLQTHSVICNKRSVVKGDISLKFKSDRYGCEACLYTTKSQRNFEEHVAFHLLAQPYICLKCVATFESKAAIESHVSLNHSDETVKCGLRGSKKISHIIEALHKDSKFTFTGRILDKKVWNISVSTPKDQSTSGQGEQVERTSTSSGKDVQSTTAKTNTTVISATSRSFLTNDNMKSILATPKTSNSGSAFGTTSASNQVNSVTQTKSSVTSVTAGTKSNATPATSVNLQNQTQTLQRTNTQGSNIVNSAKPVSTSLTTAATSAGSMTLPVILLPLSMTSNPTCGITSPRPIQQPSSTSQHMMSFITSSIGGSQPPMIVMNQQNNVRPATPNSLIVMGQQNLNIAQKAPPNPMMVMSQQNITHTPPTRYVLVPTTAKSTTPSVVIGHKSNPPNISSSRSLLSSSPTLNTQPLQASVLTTDTSSGSHTTVTASPKPSGNFLYNKSPLTNRFMTIQFNDETTGTSTTNDANNIESQKSGDEKGDSTIIDLTTGNSQTSNRISFRKTGPSYACDYCKHYTDSYANFCIHIWKHLHTMQSICKTCVMKSDVEDYRPCSLVDQVMKGLANVVRKERNVQSAKGEENDVIDLMSDDEDSAQSTIPAEKDAASPVTDDNATESIEEEESNGLQIKIASTYSLSSIHREPKPDSIPEETPEEETSLINAKKKDSGNIFEKLQGSINMVIDDTYNDSKEDKAPSVENNSTGTTSHQGQPEANPSTQVSIDPIGTVDKDPVNETESQNTNENKSTNDNAKSTDAVKFSSNGTFYVCGFTDCGFACITSAEYREHLTCWHADAEDFKCTHCGQKSNTEDCHLRHLFTHCKSSSFVLFNCSYTACLYGTNVAEMFRDHWQKFHPTSKQFKCRSCKMIFTSADDLITHIQANILKFVTCPHCTAKDSNRRTILNHIMATHPGKPRQITVASQLVCYERIYNGFSVLSEGGSDRSATKQPSWSGVYTDSAVDHIYAHSPEQNYSFDDADDIDDENGRKDKSTVSSANNSLTRVAAEGDMRDAEKVMAINKRKLKGLSAEIVRCSECSYLASGKGLLKKHLFLHKRGGDERKRRFCCPCCPATMDKLSKLSCHLNLHEGDHKAKIYFCTLCTFKTNVKDSLMAHCRKAHNCEVVKGVNFITKVLKVSVTAYFCEVCGIGTRDQQIYEQHKKTHFDGNIDASEQHVGQEISNLKPSSSSNTFSSPNKNYAASTSHVNAMDKMSLSPGTGKKFSCKICGRFCSRLPALKAHMTSHALGEDLEVQVFKCHYCAYSSTYKNYVSKHCVEKHPGKLIRVKRRVDIVAGTGAHYPLHGQETAESPDEDDHEGDVDVSNMAIDSHHCELCSYSCSDSAELLKHKNSHHTTRTESKEIKKSFIIPNGNVFKLPLKCTECPFSSRMRIEILRHIKLHPGLVPTSGASPSPPKGQKEVLKVAIGRKSNTSHQFDSNSETPSPDNEQRQSPLTEDKKPVLAEDGSIIQDEVVNSKAKSPLYFLGGDLLHLKLKPCFIQEAGNGDFTCKLCQDTFSGRYVLHKHILQHMDVFFYKCAYCNHGTLESPSMVVHIQKIHRKPIQHVQMDVDDLESRINKAIHSIKEEEYVVQMQDDDAANFHDDNDNDSSDDFQPDKIQFRSPFKSNISPSTVTTPKVMQVQSARKSTTGIKPKTPALFVSKSLQKPPLEDHPNIQRMGDIFKCKVCSYTSTSRATVLHHLTIHSGFRRFGCPFCSYRTHWKHDCHKHIRTHHPGQHGQPVTHEPPADLEITSGTATPEKPTENHQGPKQPKLPILKQPKLKLEKQRSMESEPDQDKIPEYRNVYKCLVCETKFKSIWSIQKHFTKECSQPMLGCSSCKFKDLEPSTIKLHIESKHPGNDAARIITLKREAKMRKYSIPTFRKQESAESVGIPAKSGSTNSAQDSASTTSSQSSELNQTEEMQSKPIAWNLGILIKRIGNRYICKDCGFSSMNRKAVMRHAKKHSNARPFQCSYCDYRSNNECNTKRHMSRRHIGKPVVVKRLDPSQWYLPNAPDLKYSRRPYDNDVAKPKIQETPEKKMENQNSNDPSRPRIEMRYFWKCLECGNKSNSVSNAYRHLKKGECTKALYGCSGCKLKSIDKKEVEQHVAEKHSTKNVQITLCPNTAKIRKYHIPIKIGTGFVRKAPKADPSTASVKDSTTVADTASDKSKPVEKSQVVFCSICNLKASNAKIFQNHLETEHAGMLMVCKHCTIFRTQFVSKIQEHTWEIHDGAPLKFYLRTKKGVPDSEKRPSERYTCAKCDYVGKRSSVRQHLYCHFEYKPYKCGYCAYETKKNDLVRRHIEKQHGPDKPMKIIFKRNAAQEREIEQLLDSNSPVKLSLQKSFAAKAAKDIAMKVESKPATAPPPSPLKRKFTDSHMANMAAEDFIPSKMYRPFYNSKSRKSGFSCLLCPYSTIMQNTIISHVYHHMSSIYGCPYCAFHGYPRSRVTTHIRRHHIGKSVYVMDERSQQKTETTCTLPSVDSQSEVQTGSASKRRKTNLYEEEIYSKDFRDDVKEETGKIQYSCHICDYSSESLYHYRQHLAAHGGFKWLTAGTQLESRLKCGYCSYLAANDSDFMAHMEIHLATRPFSCPYCDFSQYTHSKVKNHVSYAHPDKPLKVSRESGSSCLIDDTLQLDSVTLVQLDPVVELEDILHLKRMQFEKLLLESNVSVVDFENLPDDRFLASADNLGINVLESEYGASIKMEKDYDDYNCNVKIEEMDIVNEHVTKTHKTSEEMDITNMVTTSALALTNRNDVPVTPSASFSRKETDKEQDNSSMTDSKDDSSCKYGKTRVFSDVSDEPLSQEEDSQDTNPAVDDTHDVLMDCDSISQDSFDVNEDDEKRLLESADDANGSGDRTEDHNPPNYTSVIEKEEECALDTSMNSRTSDGEPMWASQGFQVIDEV